MQGGAGHFPTMTAVCRRASEQHKGHSGGKDTKGGKLAWVWGKRRMSSASAISEGSEELGALQVKKQNSFAWGKPARAYSGKNKYFKAVRNCQVSQKLCSLQQSHAMIFSRIFTCIWMEAKYKLKPPDLPKHLHMPAQSPRQEWYKPSPLLSALLGRGGVETEIAAELQESHFCLASVTLSGFN